MCAACSSSCARHLAQALKRFPGGSLRRWERVAEFVSAQAGATTARSKQECVDRAMASKDPGARGQATAGAPALAARPWSGAEQQQLETALKRHGAVADAKERWRRISGEVEGRSPRECLARFKEVRKALQNQA